MKKSFLSPTILIMFLAFCSTTNAQNAPKQYKGATNSAPSGKTVFNTKVAASQVRSQSVTMPQSGVVPGSASIASTLGSGTQSLNTAVNYDKDGDVLSVDGWKITFIKPNKPE